MSIMWKLEDFEPKKHTDLETPTIGLCAHIRDARKRTRAFLTSEVTPRMFERSRMVIDEIIGDFIATYRVRERGELSRRRVKIQIGQGGITEAGILKDTFAPRKLKSHSESAKRLVPTSVVSDWIELPELTPPLLLAVFAFDKLHEATSHLLRYHLPSADTTENPFGNASTMRYALAGDAVAEAILAIDFAERLADPRDPNVFRRAASPSKSPEEKSVHWFVELENEWYFSYFGEKDTIRKSRGDSLKGFRYIRHLLDRGNEGGNPLEMVIDALDPEDRPSDSGNSDKTREAEPVREEKKERAADGTPVNSQIDATTRAEILEALRKVREKRAQLEEDKEAAGGVYTPEMIESREKLENEIEGLQNYTRDCMNRDGTVRSFSDDVRKAGRGIGMDINRALSELESKPRLVDLFVHLDDSIKSRTGRHPYYDGYAENRWITDPEEIKDKIHDEPTGPVTILFSDSDTPEHD